MVIAGYGTRDGKLIECITDQNGKSKLITRDVRGNIVMVTEEGGISTTYQYDVVNQLVKVVDAAGNVTSITYDTWGRRTAIDNPDTGKTIYQYDDAGNLIAKQTANVRKDNRWIRYVYNYRQLKMIDNPNSDDVYYEYGRPGDGRNGAGRVVQEKTGKLVDSYWYGALGEVIKKERSIEGQTYRIQWQWDNFGRVRSISYSNGFAVYYAYDAGGQVKGVVGYYGNYRTDYVKDIQYDEYGSRTKVEYGNGVVSTYMYDELMHRLVQLQTKQGDSILQNIAYTYDRVGNILSRTENGIQMSDSTPKTITHRYSYDSLYRLVEAEGTIKENGDVVQSYSNAFTYNDIGNIMKKLQTVKVKGENDPLLTYNYTYSYTTNKPHAVTGINDNLTYRYDANGNMIAVYDTAKNYNRVLYWDDDNRLTKTVDTQAGVSTATQYAYDAKGMRIIKDGPYGKSIYVDTGFVLSQEYIESNHVFVGNTRIASVVKHKDEVQPATYYYATDHLGSSSVLTNQAGGYHERIEYLPYGEVWLEDSAQSSGYTTPYKFTGKELDKETGLYYFGARYYDARLSRWISTDPALSKFLPTGNKKNDNNLPAGGVFRSSNLALYIYTSNNPIIYTDPDGNWDERIHYGSKKYGGTLKWAQEVGFTKEQAERIAEACNYVDNIRSGKSYINGIGDPSYHFDTNWESGPIVFGGGSYGPDTRLVHAKEHLAKAINYMKKANSYRNSGDGVIGWAKNLIANYYEGIALDELGTGLHALQDVYAHTHDYQENIGGLYFHDSYELTGKPNMADNPAVDKYRIKQTEDATKAYLKEFIKGVNEK